MPKNVLLTTISTTSRRQNINYYYSPVLNQYCTGIASIEPGAKYYLSRPGITIDEIVVIASPETVNCSTDIPQIRENIQTTTTKNENRGPDGSVNTSQRRSDYSFFRKRMAGYLTGISSEEDMILAQADQIRLQELEKIVANTLANHGITNPSQWFDKVARTEGTQNFNYYLRDALHENIEENYLSESDYDRYITLPEDEVPHNIDLEDLSNVDRQISDALNWTEESIARDIDQTFGFNKEARKVKVREYLYDCRSRLLEAYKNHSLQSSDSDYKNTIRHLREAIKKLSRQIQDLQDAREQREQACMYMMMYIKMAPERKMQPNPASLNAGISFVNAYCSDGSDNLDGIVSHVLSLCDGEANIYLDIQGGSRTDTAVRTSVLSVLNNMQSLGIHVQEITAVNYEQRNLSNSIVSESKRYKVLDLVSGMNAFLRYGKADMVRDYCQGVFRKTGNIANAMVQIDQALSVCDIDALSGSIKKLQAAFDTDDSNSSSSESDKLLLSIMKQGIRADYGPLLTGEDMNYRELVGWAYRKTFYQQALTIIEAKMPIEIVRNGICYYCRDLKDKHHLIAYFRHEISSLPASIKYKGNNIDYYFINRTCSDNVPENDQITAYSLCSTKNMQTLIARYRKIIKLRNDTAHAGEAANTHRYQKVKDNIRLFLEIYDTCLSESLQKSNDVILISRDELNL